MADSPFTRAAALLGVDTTPPPAADPATPPEPAPTVTPFTRAAALLDESPQDYAETALKTGVMVGRSRADTEAVLKERGIKLPEAVLQHYDLQIARQKAELEWQAQNPIVQTGRKFARSFLPFGELVNQDVAGVQIGERTGDYMEAKKRLAAGQASKPDLARIAAYEQAQGVDQDAQQSFLGKVGASVGGISQMTGELAAAGGVGKAIGLAAPSTLLGSRALGFAGTQAAATLAAPSMWLEEARQRNMREGRSEYDLTGMGQAAIMGYANMLVLGRLTSRVAGPSGFSSLAGKALAAPALGTLEQGGLDTAASLVDSVLGTTLKPDGGWLNDLARGRVGKAGEEAAVNFLSFAVAGGLHELAERGGTSAAERTTRDLLTAADHAITDLAGKDKAGTAPTAAKTTATFKVLDYQTRLATAIQQAQSAGKGFTQADARKLFEDVTEPGKLRDYLDTLIGAMPTIAPKPPAPPAAPPAAVTPPAEKPVEAPVEPPPPADRHDVLTHDDLRGLIKSLGIKIDARGSREKLLEQLQKQPGMQPVLDALIAEKNPPAPEKAPIIPAPAEKAPESPPVAAPAAVAETPPEPPIAPPAQRLEVISGAIGRNAAAAQAQKHVQEGGKATYVDMDVDNMSGLAKAVGDEAAHGHVREMVRIVHEELAKVGATEVFRHAADPLGDEHSAVVYGEHAKVRSALEEAERRIRQYVGANDLEFISHGKAAKHGRGGGTGLTTFAEPFTKGFKPTDAFAEAEAGTETIKARKASPPAESPKAKSVPTRNYGKNESQEAYARRVAKHLGEQTIYDEIKDGPGIDLASAMGVDNTLTEDPRIKPLLRAEGGEHLDVLAMRYDDGDPDQLLDMIRKGRTVEGSGKAQDYALEQFWKREQEQHEQEMADAQRQHAVSGDPEAEVQEAVRLGERDGLRREEAFAAETGGGGGRPERLGQAPHGPPEIHRGPETTGGGTPQADRGSQAEKTHPGSAARIGSARKPVNLADPSREELQQMADSMDAHDLAALPRQVRADFEGRGVVFNRPGAQARKPVKPEAIPLSEEHAIMIEESDLPEHEKAGVAALMKGASVREAERIALAAGGKVSYETLRNRAKDLLGKPAIAAVEEAARQRGLALKERQERETAPPEIVESPGDLPPWALGHTKAASGVTATAGEPDTTPLSPYKAIATQNMLLDTRGHMAKEVPTATGHLAIADTRANTFVMTERAAHDPDINLEEHAHLIASRLHFPVTPEALNSVNPLLAEGFRSFFDPKAPLNTRTLMEGFAQWMLRRVKGIAPRGDAQVAADQFAEAWMRSQDLTRALDRITALHARLGVGTAEERWGALVATTGTGATALATKGEAVKTWVQTSLDSQMAKKVDDLYALVQIEKDAALRLAEENAKRFRSGQAPVPAPEPGTRASEVIRASRYRAQALIVELTKKGVFSYDETGKQVVIGTSLDKVAAAHGLSAEDIANGGALDRYMRAREAVYLADNDKPNRPPDQVALARNALDEMRKDRELYPRLERAGRDVTELFNATIKAMEMVGYHESGLAERFDRGNPFYTPNTRIMDPNGLPSTADYRKKRSMSGEEMIGLADAVQDRLEFLAYVLPKQLKDKALYENLSKPGHGDDILFYPMQLTKAGEESMKMLKGAGFSHEEAWAHMDALGDAARDYFEPGSWPADPRRMSYLMFMDGKPIRARIGSKPLYEMLTGTQGDGETTMKVATGLAALSRPIAWLQRFGFTVLAPAYHMASNMPWRDVATRLGRTVSEKGMIADARESYRFMFDSFLYYTAKLFGKDTGNVYFRLYDEMIARTLAADTHRGLGSAQVIEGGWRGLYQRVSDAMSFGEKAQHAVEMKAVWDQAGYTAERIKAELAADATGATPIPFALQVAAMNAAAEVTHNYNTMGYQVRELNKAWPFLGVHIASAYKDLGMLKNNPKIALRGLAVLATAKLAQWLLYKDDEEFKQLSLQRRDGFIWKTPVGWIGMPGPRGIQVPLLSVMDEALRATSDSNPQFWDHVEHSLTHVLPSGGPAGLTTAGELLRNRTVGGYEIVPGYEERLSASDKNLRYRLPYAGEQLTGGVLPVHQGEASAYHYLPLHALPPQHEVVSRLRDEMGVLEGKAQAAKDSGRAFAERGRLARLKDAEKRIGHLSVVLGKETDATPARRAEINRMQVQIAQGAMGTDH